MKVKHLFSLIAFTALFVACSSTPKQTQEEPNSAVSEDKEIKMEDVDDQLKSDQERMDSVKKALGIE